MDRPSEQLLQESDGATNLSKIVSTDTDRMGQISLPKPPDLLKKIRNMLVPAPGDVIIMTFPRSGTHWMHEIVWMLSNGSTEAAPFMDNFHLDLADPGDIAKVERPAVFNTHYPYPTKIADLIKDMKVIHVTRDPQDCLVSLFNVFHKGRKSWTDFWDEYCRMMWENREEHDPGSELQGLYFKRRDDFRKYTTEAKYTESRSYPVLQVKYEEMKFQPLEHVVKIAEYLGVTHSAEFMREVAEKTDFKVMKKNYTESQTHHDLHFTSPGGFLDEHYRKGVVGDWKNWFTVAQAEQFDEIDRAKTNF